MYVRVQVQARVYVCTCVCACTYEQVIINNVILLKTFSFLIQVDIGLKISYTTAYYVGGRALESLLPEEVCGTKYPMN